MQKLARRLPGDEQKSATANMMNVIENAPLLTAAIEAAGAYVQRLEAACNLLHRGIEQATGAQTASSRLTPQAVGAQPSSSGPAAHKGASAATSPTPSAPGSISAGELCTLLLTDQEVLDVVLALHDIRAAQLCHLMPWPKAHVLKLPPPSKALAQQLSQSQWSVPGSQLLSFVSALERDHDNSLEGDPLLRVWDSMHRAMLLVLAALQSLPIRPHPQHPDPAATTHTSATTQLPPGYHRCSACLLLTLRLASSLAQRCEQQRPDKGLALARLHGTLPGLLLGLSTSVTVMQAAGHPEAQAQRVQFVRCLLHLGPLVIFNMYEDVSCFGQDVVAWLQDKVTASCPDQLARLLASSPAVTGWPGALPAKPTPLDSHTAEDSPGLGHKSGRCSSNRGRARGREKGSSTGRHVQGWSIGPADPAAVNAYAHLAQALCAVLVRQEEELGTTCQAEVTTLGPSPPSPSASSSSLLSVILTVLPRSLVVFQACIVAVRIAATISSIAFPVSFPAYILDFYVTLCCAWQVMVQLWPDQKCRPAMLRLMARTAAAGAHAYTTLALLLGRAAYHGSDPSLLLGLSRMPEPEQSLSIMMARVCQMWILLLAPPGRSGQLSGAWYLQSDGQCGVANDNASSGKEKVLDQPPSAQQLAPLALDLVWGMEGMLQMTQQHWRTFQTVVIEETGTNTFTFFASCGMSLDLFGRVIEVLALSSVVGPAGLAAQPASWLPCGNSLVEGWCTRLLDRVCHLLCITTPGLEGSRDRTRFMGCRVLADSHKFLLLGRQQAPTSMSPEAERLLSCLTLVLTVALPLDTWLAVAPSLPAAEVKRVEQAIRYWLIRVEPEHVWSWQALAAGTPAEASLADLLQGAAKKLQLPHLVAPAPQGWQTGRLTLDRGRGPPELMTLCFPACLEAACHLLHRGIEQATAAQTASSRLTPQAMGAQPSSSDPAAHKEASAAASPIPSAPGSISAGELCTLLLTDQEVLDVVLALHDIRAAQLCHMPWPWLHPFKLPPPSEALAKQLSHSQWSVPGSQLLSFVSALERDHDDSLEGDPLLRVWDSMHRAMLLVLAALQSLPIRPHPQHPDPAATTLAHTTTTQLPPGYHRCSACLLLSLRLVLSLAHHCVEEQQPNKNLALARLHGTLLGLLLGLSTSVTVMQAAGHPEAQSQHSQFVRCLLHLAPLVISNVYEDHHISHFEDVSCFGQDVLALVQDKVTTSCPDQLACLLASSLVVTGWPGPLPSKPSPMNSSTAEDSPGLGHKSSRCSSTRADPAAVNAYAHLAQALCAVLGRQEEELGITCQAEGPDAWSMWQGEVSNLASATVLPLKRECYCAHYMADLLEAVSVPSHPGAVTTLGPPHPSTSASSSSLLAVILSVLPRSLVVYQACVAAFRFALTTRSIAQFGLFPACIRDFYFPLCDALGLMVQLWPDQRCRPAMLRVMVRSAAAGAHAYTTLALLLDGAPDHGLQPRSGLRLARTPELEHIFYTLMAGVCHVWILLLAPPGRDEQLSGASYTRSDGESGVTKDNASNGKQKVLHQPPSAEQLAPLALDLVWGMEGMLQMMHQHWCTFQTVVIEEIGINTFTFFGACGTSLDLFGRVIEVLATPSVVGPAGLAAQPASWLPCGNSLVEGWCTRLLAGVCQLLCITTPGLEGSQDDTRFMGCWVLADSHKFLLQGRQQAPPSMSPEAERLLACLTLVLTVALPLDTWLAAIASVQADEVKVIEQGLCELLTRVEAEHVWSWQALAAGTPAEASLASVLQGAAKKLQLPHLVAPAPQGWQPGRLTLDRGRGPPELMRLCFPKL
ncbi:hypothetical protein QJQ45_004990 [Haematococcus lacustris]|nr:hypothetical protein QJQ45_004990 [Haematococcus lacustris]